MNHLPASRHAKKAKIVIDDEEDEWEEGIDMKKKGKEESGASEDDDLADSSSEEELDSESDGEHSAKRIRLKKRGQAAAKSVGPSSRPPLAPVKICNSTPLQSQKLSNTTPAQKQSTSVYDRCTAQKVGSTDLQSNVSTPCSNDSPGSNSSTPSMPVLPEGVVGRGSHEHNAFDFLHPNMRKDKDGNRPDSLKYNPRTCFVPQSFVLKQTPAMAQWWILKQDNMDTVLFFKVRCSTMMTIHAILYIILTTIYSICRLDITVPS